MHRHWAIGVAVQVSDLASVSELADSEGVGTQVFSRAGARAPRAGSLATFLGKRHSPGRANSRGLCHSRSVGLAALPPYLAGHVRWTRRRGAGRARARRARKLGRRAGERRARPQLLDKLAKSRPACSTTALPASACELQAPPPHGHAHAPGWPALAAARVRECKGASHAACGQLPGCHHASAPEM